MERLQWIFDITDKVSGPAGRMHQSISKIDAGFERLGRSATAAEGGMGRAGSSFARIATRAIPAIIVLGHVANAILAVSRVGRMMGISANSMRSAFRMMRFGAKRALGGLRDLGRRGVAALKQIPPSAYVAAAALGAAAVAAKAASMAFSAVLSVVSALGLAVAAAGFAAVAAAVKGATSAVDALVARERNVRALTMLSGGNEAEGLRLRKRFSNMSEFLGIDPRDVQTGMQNLLTKGFGETEAVRIFQGVADVATFSPDADPSRIILAMSQIKQAGVLQGDELNQLAESGLPLENVYKRIAKAMGYAGDDAAAWVRAQRGTVQSSVAIKAILEGIQDVTGKELGGVAREASLGLGGMIERLKQMPTRFFESLADESSDAGKRLTGLLTRLEAFLNPSGAMGQKILNGMITAFDKLVTGIELTSHFLTVAWAEGKKFMASIPPGLIDRLVEGFKIIGYVVGGTLVAAFGLVAAAAAGVALWVADFVADVGQMSQAVQAAIAWFGRMGSKVMEMGAQMIDAGARLVAGFAAGIRNGIGAAVAAVSELGSSVVGRLRGLLQIHSPSRVFMGLGSMTGEGFSIGLERSMPGIDFGGVGGASALGASASSLGAVAGGAAGGASISAPISIQVQAAAGEDPEELATRIGDAVRRELAALFEGFALESGTN